MKCENCDKKEATKELNLIVSLLHLCDICHVTYRRKIWLDRILSADFNSSVSGSFEPWSDEQIVKFLEKNFPYPEEGGSPI